MIYVKKRSTNWNISLRIHFLCGQGLRGNSFTQHGNILTCKFVGSVFGLYSDKWYEDDAFEGGEVVVAVVVGAGVVVRVALPTLSMLYSMVTAMRMVQAVKQTKQVR